MLNEMHLRTFNKKKLSMILRRVVMFKPYKNDQLWQPLRYRYSYRNSILLKEELCPERNQNNLIVHLLRSRFE